MADDASKFKISETPSTSPVPPKNEKIGSLVERLRSYESDMARLKGVHLDPVVPDAPLVPLQPKPKINISGIAGKAEPHVEAQGNTAKAVEASNTIVSNVVKEDPQKAIDALHKQAPIENFRTIQTDSVVAAQQKTTTTVQDIISEAQRHNPAKARIIEDPRRGFYLLMLSGILLGGGLLALGGFYVIKNLPKPPQTIVTDVNNIITTDSTETLVVGSDEEIIPIILSVQKQAEGSRNEIIKLNFTQGSSSASFSAEQFATRLSPTLPDWLARSFDPVYLAGLYSSATGWHPVFIFKIDSYENGYAGMIKWEETMVDELRDFFPTKQTRVVIPSVATSSATTTTQITPVVPTGFRDAIIKNKDVRVLEDTSGRRLILYSFPDPTTLVIATDQAALEEVFARLTTSKFVR